MEPIFPAEFADLEPFAEWSIPTERARFAKRMASSMDELQTFYDTAFPRLEGSVAHLKQVDLEGISEGDKRLLWLFCSLVTVSFPVEVWRQPKVPDSGAASIDAVLEPSV